MDGDCVGLHRHRGIGAEPGAGSRVLPGGNVTVRLRTKSTGAKLLLATTSFVVAVGMKNLGPAAA